MPWNDEVQIETPEQVHFGLELAGLGSRFVAQVIDWIAKFSLLIILGALGLILAALAGTANPFQKASGYVIALLIGMGYALVLGFDIYFEVQHNGQTPGKKVAQIRVVREGGAPVDFNAAAIRNLLALADLLPAFYLLGGFLVLFTSRSQRLGDMAAGTIVIRDRPADLPLAEEENWIEALASPDYRFTPEQLAACAPEDRFILRSYFLRTAEMDNHASRLLALRLVEQFTAKMSYPATQLELDYPEQFLASLYRELKALARHGQ